MLWGWLRVCGWVWWWPLACCCCAPRLAYLEGVTEWIKCTWSSALHTSLERVLLDNPHMLDIRLEPEAMWQVLLRPNARVRGERARWGKRPPHRPRSAARPGLSRKSGWWKRSALSGTKRRRGGRFSGN